MGWYFDNLNDNSTSLLTDDGDDIFDKKYIGLYFWSILCGCQGVAQCRGRFSSLVSAQFQEITRCDFEIGKGIFWVCIK